jgi:outer membrane biosynthesis protein TonB
MSVLEELRAMEVRIATRLAELEPLVQEYNELQAIAERLEIDTAVAAEAKPVPPAAAKPVPAAAAKPVPPVAAKAPAKPAPKAAAKPVPKAAAKAVPKAAAKPKAKAKAKAKSKPRPAAPLTKFVAKPVTGPAVRRQPGGTQRAGAERREAMLALIREQPGITVPELSDALAVDAPSLYRVVRRLISDGTIAKKGKELRLSAS